MINYDYLAASVATKQVELMHSAADRSRMRRSYRRLHPPLQLRPRLAQCLRRAADRLTPAEQLEPTISRPTGA